MPRLLAPLATAAALLALPASAGAATAADVPVGMTDRDMIAVHGTTVAYVVAGEARVAIARANGPTRTFPKRGEAAGLSLGHDAAGRLVLVYPTCASKASVRRCRLQRVDVATGRTSLVRGIRPGSISLPVLRRGTLAWLDAGRVMARPLVGGRAKRQDLGRGRLEVTGLDHDGRRFAVTGSLPQEEVLYGSTTELRVGRLGRSGTKILRSLSSTSEYRSFRTPMLGRDDVVVIDEHTTSPFEDATSSSAVIRFSLSGRKRERHALRVPFTAMAQGGGRMAFVQVPSDQGCAVPMPMTDDDTDQRLVSISCRVVLAGALPFGRAARSSLPSVRFGTDGRHVLGRVERTIVPPPGRTASRTVGVPGATVRIVDVDERKGFRPNGIEVRTDAAGRFRALLPDATPRTLGVVLVDPFPAFSPTADLAGPTPGPDDVEWTAKLRGAEVVR